MDGPWSYSDEAYDTFPRYNVRGAILQDVERFVPADFASPDELRETLRAAGETARRFFVDGKTANAVEAIAIDDERRRFANLMRELDPVAAAAVPRHELNGAGVPQPPYRRPHVASNRSYATLSEGRRATERRRAVFAYSGIASMLTMPASLTSHPGFLMRSALCLGYFTSPLC